MIGSWWLFYTNLDLPGVPVKRACELMFTQGQLVQAREAAQALWDQLSATRVRAVDGLLYPRSPMLVWSEPLREVRS